MKPHPFPQPDPVLYPLIVVSFRSPSALLGTAEHSGVGRGTLCNPRWAAAQARQGLGQGLAALSKDAGAAIRAGGLLGWASLGRRGPMRSPSPRPKSTWYWSSLEAGGGGRHHAGSERGETGGGLGLRVPEEGQGEERPPRQQKLRYTVCLAKKLIIRWVLIGITPRRFPSRGALMCCSETSSGLGILQWPLKAWPAWPHRN